MTLLQLCLYILIASMAALGVHYLVKKSIDKPWLSFLQYFSGFLFLISGWVKAVDPLGTAYKMEQYFTEFEITFQETWLSFIAPLFPWLSSMSVGFSVFMIILEIVLGYMIVVGARPKFTAWAFFVIILFFTALTGFTFLTGYVTGGANFFDLSAWGPYNENNMRVTDCGCFGDFIKLEPRISFYKDLILLIPAVLFLIWRTNWHRWGTTRFHDISVAGLVVVLLVYCMSNFAWDIPHVDFRPFKKGADIAAQKMAEDESAGNVQVLAFQLKNKETGDITEVAYDEYLAGISSTYSKDKYEVVGQVQSEHELEATKVSDFEYLDSEGNIASEDLLVDQGYTLMLIGHKLEYELEKYTATRIDTTYALDSTLIEAADTSYWEVEQVIVSIDESEEEAFRYIFKPSFLDKWKHAVEVAGELEDKEVKTIILAGGVGQEVIGAFGEALGVTYPIYEADDILLKTIVRSNPGYVLWKAGVIINKWHYKKIDGADEIVRYIN
jgi:uncharacterized membrane protein YphA (DoxX/SURF4 family)